MPAFFMSSPKISLTGNNSGIFNLCCKTDNNEYRRR